jgi:hypothetical protein
MYIFRREMRNISVQLPNLTGPEGCIQRWQINTRCRTDGQGETEVLAVIHRTGAAL